MDNKDSLDINLDKENIDENTKRKIKNSNKIHIHKNDDDEKVDIDIDKNKKTVNVNVNKNKNGKKTNVKFGLSGVKVKDGDESVNIQFWPIFLFVGLIIFGFFFLVYKVIALFVH